MHDPRLTKIKSFTKSPEIRQNETIKKTIVFNFEQLCLIATQNLALAIERYMQRRKVENTTFQNFHNMGTAG